MTLDDTAVMADFLSEESFWHVNYLVESAWIEHAPFAFWLARAMRPRSFVELGTHRGFSYFAFCQAFQRLSLQTKCFAVDTWTGDEHAGHYDESVFRSVGAYSEATFGLSSTLVRETFEKARARFEPQSVDLLHIDGSHYYEDVRADVELWMPTLSERGVLLLHDIEERGRGFGVYRLWAELESQYPSFAFTHGHGLGVVAVGSDAPQLVERLTVATADQAIGDLVRDAYSRLGWGIQNSFLAQDRDRALAEFAKTADSEAREFVSAIEADRESIRADLAATRGLLERRESELAGCTSELVRCESELLRCENELVRSESEKEAMRREYLVLTSSNSWRLTSPLRALRHRRTQGSRDAPGPPSA